MIKVNRKVGKIIGNVIYVLILLPLIIVSARIAFQKVFYPEMIPDIFGYKMFVILDDNMDESLKYGDLVVTYNKKANDLKENELIAYRTDINTVTITSKNVNIDKFEGAVVNRIPKLGSVLYFISQPIVMLVISCIILSIGGVWIYFAKKLDEKDMKQIQLEISKMKEIDEEQEENIDKEQQEENFEWK